MLWFWWLTAWLLSGVSAVEFDIYANSNENTQEPDSLVQSYEQLNNNSLLWGPYRSGLYFGVRPRIPRSLLSGLMWFSINDFNGVKTVRHAYEQHDNMRRANWVNYDPRYGGRQVIEDNDCHVRIVIDFVKTSDGQSWAAKVRAIPYKGYENTKISFIWYSGLETDKSDSDNLEEGFLTLDTPESSNGYLGDIKLKGMSDSLGLFEIQITDGPSTNKHPPPILDIKSLDSRKTHHLSLHVPNDNIWRAKDILATMLQDSIEGTATEFDRINELPPHQVYILRNLQQFSGNLHFIQKFYQGACEFDIIFNNAITPYHDKFDVHNLNDRIKKTNSLVKSKFGDHFKLSEPYNEDPKYEKFAREILSGLLGGLNYAYGDELVDRQTIFDENSFESHELNGELESPHELFCLVPSRPFFPRGFYWDEGFHLLPLLKYDTDLVLSILKSWFVLVDENGWIAREQILGPEARSRVPEQFQTQSPEIVNPPTMMLALSYLLDNIDKNKDMIEPLQEQEFGSFEDTHAQLGNVNTENPQMMVNYTKQLYPSFKKHYEMFRRTQMGYIEDFGRENYTEVYRWRGRTLTHCLASGLDDYPRALPADIAELNVDLLSWVGVMTKSMISMANILELEQDIQQFEKYQQEIIDNLNKIHWSEKDGAYCDVSVNDDDEAVHVCHKGYISLFPFITKLMPNSDVDKLSQIVDLIRDPQELWTNFGLRSLSKSDKYYRTEENYWRSPIWPHMNYLVLDALIHYKHESEPYASPEILHKLGTTYHDLRLNLVNNVYEVWKKTGFVWENYDDETGGQGGAKNFLGWGSTILLIMQMPTEI